MTNDLFSKTLRSSKNRPVLTVSRLNQDAKALLESGFGIVCLKGEISNFSRSVSGHYYFSMKDSRAQIRCAMFKSRNRYVDLVPENGRQILARGRISLYEIRGDFQFIVEHIELAGEGLLQQQFEQRFEALKSEGFFDQLNKRPLPDYPQRIGVITSSTGAALQDVLDVLVRRYPIAEIRVYPTIVQGVEAAQRMVQQLARASDDTFCDVLLLVRGGGSTEDLWPFNEEVLVRAMSASTIPIVTGIGHETDMTLADFAADLRAPTPSAAAELACPDQRAVKDLLRARHEALEHALIQRLQHTRQYLKGLGQRLEIQSPQRQLQQKYQRCDDIQRRLESAIKTRIEQHKRHLRTVELKLLVQSPTKRISLCRDAVKQCRQRIYHRMQNRQAQAKAQFKEAIHALHVASPMATLARGYSITRDPDSLELVGRVADTDTGKRLITRLIDGEIESQVLGLTAKS